MTKVCAGPLLLGRGSEEVHVKEMGLGGMWGYSASVLLCGVCF
jgi:hypothetical protein